MPLRDADSSLLRLAFALSAGAVLGAACCEYWRRRCPEAPPPPQRRRTVKSATPMTKGKKGKKGKKPKRGSASAASAGLSRLTPQGDVAEVFSSVWSTTFVLDSNLLGGGSAAVLGSGGSVHREVRCGDAFAHLALGDASILDRSDTAGRFDATPHSSPPSSSPASASSSAPPPLSYDHVITSLPDLCELCEAGITTVAEYRRWFLRAATLVLTRAPAKGFVVFYQTDGNLPDGTYLDKSVLLARAADDAGAALIWRKVVCAVVPGKIKTGTRVGFSHLMCFSRAGRDVGPRNTIHQEPDVIATRGIMTWPRAMGSEATGLACRFLAKHRRLAEATLSERGEQAVANCERHLREDEVKEDDDERERIPERGDAEDEGGDGGGDEIRGSGLCGGGGTPDDSDSGGRSSHGNTTHRRRRPRGRRETILDPFCGQGSVLAVANASGFNAVGVELSQKRCRIAAVQTLEGNRNNSRAPRSQHAPPLLVPKPVLTCAPRF